MKKKFKKVFIGGLIIFLGIQLYQPARNTSSGQDLTANFTKGYKFPKNVEAILRTSCYDCHSNNTNYPWYSNIQPVRLFMDSHINEGKEELNFSEWENYSEHRQNSKLNKISKEIKSDEMPLASYTLIHKNASLTDTQKTEVLNWINTIEDSISSQNEK